MKLKLLLSAALVAALGVGALQARTWTSADGSKTFVGEFKSYDADAKKVTVIMRNGRNVTFDIGKLSEADQTFAQEQNAAPGGGADVAAKLKEQKAGSKIAKVVEKFDGKRYAKHELDKAPEFYILYFSASW